MKENFGASLKFVLASEGGNVDDPADRGGRTSRGVTQRVYDAYCRLHDQPVGDVFRATDEEIAEIYHISYWEPWCDLLPLGVDYAYFDFAVNAGPHRAMMALQEAAGTKPDGVFGPASREAIGRVSPEILIQRMAAYRVRFYSSLHEARFIHGWLRRNAAVEKAALAMARGH